MLFMNTMDIDDAVIRYSSHPIVGKAARLLRNFADMIDDNSDGWAHWPAAPRACKKLMELIQSQETRGKGWDFTPPAVTESELKAAIKPMKSFCTRKGLPSPCM